MDTNSLVWSLASDSEKSGAWDIRPESIDRQWVYIPEMLARG